MQMVFHRYPRAQVYITGFDGFASGHYFEENAEKFCHPWNAEQQQIQAWADSGKLIILDRETSR